jgi:hypothetical protein
MISTKSTARPPFAALRELARKELQVERCDLCGVPVAEEHTHLIEPVTRRLVCCCDVCAILFSSGQSPNYRLVPRQVRYWPHFRMTDAQWDDLHIPINLAFFLRSTPAGRVLAMYPSPAGPMESLLTLESWSDLVADNPPLGRLEPDVEALLVNRVGEARAYYVAPIDECYKLVGLIRAHWRGLSGGAEVWEKIGRFFCDLKAKSGFVHGGDHA